jgi:hypothetical protein
MDANLQAALANSGVADLHFSLAELLADPLLNRAEQLAVVCLFKHAAILKQDFEPAAKCRALEKELHALSA